jgi:SAM-dependent methyltransferase
MTNCTLCGFETDPLFAAIDYARPDNKTTYYLSWCQRCSYGQIDRTFNPEEISNFYPSNYYTHSKEPTKFREPTLREKLRMAIAWRFDQGSDFQPSELSPDYKSICDIGCGNGHYLRMFKELGFRTVGIEPDPEARLAADGTGAIFDGTAEDLPREMVSDQFDVVLMSHVLEHCDDPIKAVSNARDLLSNSGTLVIEVPNNASVGFRTFKAAWPFTDLPRHLHFFTEKSLFTLLESQSLDVTNVQYCGFTVQFSPTWVDAQNNIWQSIASDRKAPNFNAAAWRLLMKTALLVRSRKYYSVRVHAVAKR